MEKGKMKKRQNIQVLSNVCKKIQTPRCRNSWEMFDEILNWKKRKQDEKDNDKHENADSRIHDTSSRT